MIEKRRRRGKTETNMLRIGLRILSLEEEKWRSISIMLLKRKLSGLKRRRWISKIALNSENKLNSKRRNLKNLKIKT